MKARIIKIKLKLYFLLVILLMLSFAFVTSGVLARADYTLQDNEVNIVSSADTGYKISLKTTGVDGYMIDAKNATVMSPFGGSYWERSNVNHTVIFRFDTVKYVDKDTQKELSPMLIGTVSISQPSHWSFSKRFTFNNDINVRTTLAYYNLLKNHLTNTAKSTLTLYVDGKGYKLETKDDNLSFDVGIVLSTYDKESGEDDPDSPNFNPEGSGGMDATGTNESYSLWYSVYNFFVDLGLPISYRTFNIITVIIGGLIVLSFLMALLLRVRGK